MATQETKWAKGPWEAVLLSPDELAIVDSTGSYVALADWPDLANNADKVDASGHLIAAAPELYDSTDPDLLNAVADDLQRSGIGGERVRELRLMAIRQRDARAKARGERPIT